jgi:hypothetical protein
MPLEARAMGAMGAINQKFGETGALIAYYAHIVPALMDAERGRRRRDPHAVIRKAQAITINLRKLTADLHQENLNKAYVTFDQLRQVPLDREPLHNGSTHYFAGNPVVAGKARTSEGNYDLLHEDDNHYIATPEGKAPEPHTLCKLPKAKEGTHFTVLSRPSVLVHDLD